MPANHHPCRCCGTTPVPFERYICPACEPVVWASQHGKHIIP